MGRSREKVNILMVDDLPAKLLSYEAILSGLNENLIKATSAREALEHLLKKDFAVVLMDVSMPEVDGFELAAMIHEHPRHGETAIIFVSGVHLTDLDRLKAYQRGAVDYVAVPIIPEILRAKVSVFVDLYRKRQQLEEINLELEHRVAERTEELQKRNEELQKLNKDLLSSQESLRESQRSLQQALSAAEQASRLKDQFLATVSHELRTPLNAIVGWSQILQSSSLEPAITGSALSAIAVSAKNQTQIINDLLDMERIVNGKMNLQPQYISLTDLLSSALNTLTHAITAKNIRVSSQFHDGTHNLCLYADPQRLEQVFWNVLSNAVKFSSNGGRIEIEAQLNSSGAQISIFDWGKGISPEFLPFVFERFRQEDSSTTRRFGGLGLGLSIAKHLLELHGGSIAAFSEGEARGAKFAIHLPATLIREPNTVQEEDLNLFAANSAKPTFPNLSKARVLLVDDDPNTLDLLIQTFKAYGAELKACQSGLVALSVSNAWQPDLLISDVAMPNHDGYWLIRQVRSGKSLIKNIPAIALTAYASHADQSEALSAGFNIFMPKPVEPFDLLSMANNLLDGQKDNTTSGDADIFAAPRVKRSAPAITGKKILIVEDDLIFTEVLRTAFLAEGLQFRSAASASEAIAIVTEWRPDAIISDLGLPDEDGYSLIQKIRALPSIDQSAIPALALTGYGTEGGTRALAAGFHAFRSKPVEPSSLVSILVDLFKVR